MKKFVVIPGVGFNKKPHGYNKFISNVSRRLEGWEGSLYLWEHSGIIPKNDYPLSFIRDWVAEVIFDFQYIISQSLEIFVPKADLYIGHSAGSILALTQQKTPCICFGSPAELTYRMNESVLSNTSLYGLYGYENEKLKEKQTNLSSIINTLKKDDKKILNIINRYDVLAYPIEFIDCKNIDYSSSVLNPLTYLPVSAHLNYWKSKFVENEVVNFINNL
jgi:hypothetical protein